MWILIPVKRFQDAKSRLANSVAPAERAKLARNMAATVIRAAVVAQGVERVYVLTSDPDALALARSQGADALDELESNSGFNSVIGTALDRLTQRGATRLMYLASDLPDLTAKDIEQFIALHGADVSIGHAMRDGGTNALLLAAPRRLTLAFGPDSARRHLANAAAAGLGAKLIDIPGISNDLDTMPLALTGTCA